MKKYIPIILVTLGILGAVAALVSWKMFSYKECKAVGHSSFYCWMMLGSK